MVIRIAGLGYQKGFGGHFHNDNSFAVFRDIPGLIIACPSNGADAVAMLRESVRLAHEEQRVVIFLEPIALYMTKDLHETGDGLWASDYIPEQGSTPLALGDITTEGSGDELCIISYANGYYLSRQAQKVLMETGLRVRVIDIRWLAPLNIDGIVAQAKECKHILIVDECRKTGSISEALMTGFAEALGEACPPIARLTADDCFIPLADAATLPLPSKESIIEAAMNLIDKELNQSLLKEAL